MRVPWQLLLTQAPKLMAAAGELINSRTQSAEIADARDLHQLRDRVADVARDQERSTALLKELTDQLDRVTAALQALANRVRAAMILAAVAAALGLAALTVALLR